MERVGRATRLRNATPWQAWKSPSFPRRVFDRAAISDERRSERTRAVNEFRTGPTGHKFRGAASGAPRKNRTWETRRLAQSIRDVAFASRRELSLKLGHGVGRVTD
jgi:hypothetical protein